MVKEVWRSKDHTFNCSSFSSKVVFKVAISSFRAASRLSLSSIKGKKSSPSSSSCLVLRIFNIVSTLSFFSTAS